MKILQRVEQVVAYKECSCSCSVVTSSVALIYCRCSSIVPTCSVAAVLLQCCCIALAHSMCRRTCSSGFAAHAGILLVASEGDNCKTPATLDGRRSSRSRSQGMCEGGQRNDESPRKQGRSSRRLGLVLHV